MKKVIPFVATILVTCVTAMPAFADDLLSNLPIVGSWFGGSPAGAPAPLLAAGIPAFIAIGGGALAMKFFARRRKSAE
jgi:hypothetical protein